MIEHQTRKAMTPDPRNLELMDFPFLRESVAVLPATGRPVTALPPSHPADVVTGLEIQSSDGGEREPSQAPSCFQEEVADEGLSADTVRITAGVAAGPSDPFPVPAGYVLVAQENFDRMMELIVELQAERAADQIDHADYERLREKERVELLTPPPSFLKRQDFSRAMERAAE